LTFGASRCLGWGRAGGDSVESCPFITEFLDLLQHRVPEGNVTFV